MPFLAGVGGTIILDMYMWAFLCSDEFVPISHHNDLHWRCLIRGPTGHFGHFLYFSYAIFFAHINWN